LSTIGTRPKVNPMTEQEEPPEVTADEVTISGIFPDASRWGHRIDLEFPEDEGMGSVNGHITIKEGETLFGNGRTVEDGDAFAHDMSSGRVAVFRLVNVENCGDPRDQFFADAEPLGYLREDDKEAVR